MRTDRAAVVPRRASADAAGYDLVSIEACTLESGEWRLLRTGLCVQLPAGHYGRIESRSGLVLRHKVAAQAGVIDADYRGEVCVVLGNFGARDFEVRAGDRIAQLVVQACVMDEFVEVPALAPTERGSTGK